MARTTVRTMADPRLRKRAERIVAQALEKTPKERRAFLRRACGRNAALRRAVKARLEAEPTDVETAATSEETESVEAGAEVDISTTVMPRTIGQYRLLELLEHDGGTNVYRARETKDKIDVVVKVTKPATATPRLRRRVRDDATPLARLDHRGLARVYQIGWVETAAGHRLYCATEAVSGTSIIEHANRAPLGQGDRVDVLTEVCDAVQHGHRKGLVHGDLAPSCLVVEADGAPRVLDFGLARVLVTAGVAPDDEDEIGGAIPYASPEVLSAGPGAADAKSDVYSLGVILFELLFGRLPYDVQRATRTEALRTLRRHDPVMPHDVVAEVPGDLEAIVLKAIDKKPGRRYVSVEKLALDLRRHLEGDRVSVRPIRKAEPAKATKAGGGSIFAKVVGALLLAGLGATGWWGYQNHVARQEAEREVTELRIGANVATRDDETSGPALTTDRPDDGGSGAPSGVVPDEVRREVERLKRELAAAKGELGTAKASESEARTAAATATSRLDAVGTASGDAGAATDIYRSILELGSPDFNRGRELPIEIAVTNFAKALDDQTVKSRRRALGYLAVGEVFRRLDRLDEAKERLEEAVELLRGYDSEDSTTLADARVRLATVLLERGEEAERVETLLTTAVQAQRTAGNAVGEVRALHGLALSQVGRDELDPAEKTLRRALELQAKIEAERGSDEMSAKLRGEFADVLSDRFRFDEAMPYVEEALKRLGDLPMPNPALRARLLLAFAPLAAAKGDAKSRRRAVDAAREGIAIVRRVYSPDHLDLASRLFEAGSVLMRIDDLGEAEAWLLESVAIIERKGDRYRPRLAMPLGVLGAVHAKQKRLTDAERCLRRSLSLVETHWGKDSENIATILQTLGHVQFSAERIEAADASFARAVEVASATDDTGRRAAEVAGQWAATQLDRRDFARAAELYVRSRKEFARSLKDDDPTLRFVWLGSGDAQFGLEKFDDALTHYRAARAGFETSSVPDAASATEATIKIARALAKSGRADEADAARTDARRRLEALGAEHPRKTELDGLMVAAETDGG